MKDKKLFNKKLPDYMRFGEKFPDGRLVNEPDGKRYRLREAFIMVKKIGRPLTEEEMKQFEVKNLEDFEYEIRV